MRKCKLGSWGFLNTGTLPGLIGKWLLLLAIPYAYLMLCGLVFDMWLKWYFMTGFIFYSLLVLYAAAIALAVWVTVRFVKSRKKGQVANGAE